VEILSQSLISNPQFLFFKQSFYHQSPRAVEAPGFRHGGKVQGNLFAVKFDFITALELLESVYFCTVLSMGQLPFQILQPCTHNGFAHLSLPKGVMLASTMLEVGTIQTTLV
jgi:hypothetical protein